MSTAQAEKTPESKVVTALDHDAVSDDLRLDDDTQGVDPQLQEQPVIALDRVKPDPINVRENLNLNARFLADLEANGIEVPMLVRADPDEPGTVRIVEGHRRYFGAHEARNRATAEGRLTPEVERRLSVTPYRLLPSGEDDSGSAANVRVTSTYLRMYRTNHPDQRINHTVWEQGKALFLAADLDGLTRSQLRRETGLTSKEVDQALSVGRLSKDTIEAAEEVASDWNLADAALNAEFEDDPPRLRRCGTPSTTPPLWSTSSQACGGRRSRPPSRSAYVMSSRPLA